MSVNNNHYNKRLKTFARELRSNETQAEKKLWYQVLRGKRMLGYHFLRQRIIGNYIADFYCKELNLVIELDGLTHTWEETVAKDARKEADLANLGYTILRFSDEQIMNDLNNVVSSIEGWIEEYKRVALG